MGHADDGVDATYTRGIGRDRLAAVAEQVRGWLFAPTDPTPAGVAA